MSIKSIKAAIVSVNKSVIYRPIINIKEFIISENNKMCIRDSRRAFSISEIEKAIIEIRKINKDVIIFVDNCYGEFTEIKEPIEIGADIIAGSLIRCV